MARSPTAARAGLKAARATPAKGKVAKAGYKLGRRRAERTPAGTVVLYAQALVGNDRARSDLREACVAARKAYRRSADGNRLPNLVTLLQDRKASKEAGNAIESARDALRVAGRTRRKPRSAKGPALAVVVVGAAGAGIVLVRRRQKPAESADGTGSPEANGQHQPIGQQGS